MSVPINGLNFVLVGGTACRMLEPHIESDVALSDYTDAEEPQKIPFFVPEMFFHSLAGPRKF